MRAALLTLADTDRELLLVTWDELSYEEAAAVLDLPLATVRSKLQRAKARLRERLDARRRGWRRSAAAQVRRARTG
jgi:RNA polymerase sigma-70 factor (ECF subfamily)